MFMPLTHGAGAKEELVISCDDMNPNNREPILNNTLPQSHSNNTLPQPIDNTESAPMFFMFVQPDGQQPTSSVRIKQEDITEGQQSATDNEPQVPRPPLYTKWNPDSGMLKVRRGYRTPTPDGTYVTRTWTEAPPARHVVNYEGMRSSYGRLETRVHNPRTGFFELKRSPVISSTVSPVRQPISIVRTDIKIEAPEQTLQIIESTNLPIYTKTSQITKLNITVKGVGFKCSVM